MKINGRRITARVTFVGLVLSLSMLTGASLTTGQEPATKPSASDDHPEFPAGPGRDTTLSKCSTCHSPNNLLATGRDRQGWQDIILKMVDLGATGTDEEFGDILDYVSKSFPPSAAPRVNVNTADAAKIATVLTLTTEEAKQIVDYREKNGLYKTIDDLKKVPNVDPKKLEARKTSLLF